MVLLHAAARARCQRPAWHHGIVRCVSRTHRRCTLSRTSRLWTPAQDSVGRGIEQHTLAQKIRRVNMLPPVASVRSVALHHHAGLGSIRPLRHVQNHAEHTFSVKMRCATRAPRVSRRSDHAPLRPRAGLSRQRQLELGQRSASEILSRCPHRHHKSTCQRTGLLPHLPIFGYDYCNQRRPERRGRDRVNVIVKDILSDARTVREPS